jgi:transcriptional regulator with XRE-family HTH domain
MSDIREQIRIAREAKGLTQAGLGQRLAQPQSSISRIERGGDLRLSTLLEVARVLDLEPMLIPKILVPAVGAMIDQAAGRGSLQGGRGTFLVGGDPEDADEDPSNESRFWPAP